MTTHTHDVRFTQDHEWLRMDKDSVVVVGITDYALLQLGDLVYVQLPTPGEHYNAGAEMAVIESVKAAGDIKAPLAGTVVEANAGLAGDPSKANDDPMGEGWFVKLKLDDPAGFDSLMTVEAYSKLLEGQA